MTVPKMGVTVRIEDLVFIVYAMLKNLSNSICRQERFSKFIAEKVALNYFTMNQSGSMSPIGPRPE